jgi:hypothetical protein
MQALFGNTVGSIRRRWIVRQNRLVSVSGRQRKREWKRREWNKNEWQPAATGGATQWGQCHFHPLSYDLNVMWTVMHQTVHARIGMWTGAVRVLHHHHHQLLLCRGMNHLHVQKQRLGDRLVRDLHL